MVRIGTSNNAQPRALNCGPVGGGCALPGMLPPACFFDSRLMTGRDGLNMSELFHHYGDLIKERSDRQDEVESRLAQLEKNNLCTIAGLGLVRFNAFGENGGDLSFSLALLNRNLDGTVITGIYGRDNSRVFCKLIRGGRSGHELRLSEEEKDALHEARKTMVGDW